QIDEALLGGRELVHGQLQVQSLAATGSASSSSGSAVANSSVSSIGTSEPQWRHTCAATLMVSAQRGHARRPLTSATPAVRMLLWNSSMSALKRLASALLCPWLRSGSVPPAECTTTSANMTPWLTVTDEIWRRLMLSSTRPVTDDLMRVT